MNTYGRSIIIVMIFAFDDWFMTFIRNFFQREKFSNTETFYIENIHFSIPFRSNKYYLSQNLQSFLFSYSRLEIQNLLHEFPVSRYHNDTRQKKNIIISSISGFIYFPFSSTSSALLKSLITSLVIIPFLYSNRPLYFSSISFSLCSLNYSKYPLLKYRFLQKRRRNERFKGYPRKTRTLEAGCSCELFESAVFFPLEGKERLDFGRKTGKVSFWGDVVS